MNLFKLLVIALDREIVFIFCFNEVILLTPSIYLYYLEWNLCCHNHTFQEELLFRPHLGFKRFGFQIWKHDTKIEYVEGNHHFLH